MTDLQGRDGELLHELQQISADLFADLPCEAVVQPGTVLETVGPRESVHAALNRMWWRQVGALPVVEDGRLVGCFAEEDLLRLIASRLESQGSEASDATVRSAWDELRALAVAEAMTPSASLPLVASGSPLLEGLREAGAADVRRGRYLFILGEGPSLRLASYRDVARYLTALYDGHFEPAAFASSAGARRAREAARQCLDLAVGEVRRRTGFGHEPNVVDVGLRGPELIRAMWKSQRGYVIVSLPDGGPVGICTRRDVLRACVPRYADLARWRLGRLMSLRVKTVGDTDTLCGLFKRMALESFRHMPLVDPWDRLECVISMWEGVSLVAGMPPKNA